MRVFQESYKRQNGLRTTQTGIGEKVVQVYFKETDTIKIEAITFYNLEQVEYNIIDVIKELNPKWITEKENSIKQNLEQIKNSHSRERMRVQ